MITTSQLRTLQAELQKRFGSDREARLTFLGEFFSQPIKTTKELSSVQAFVVIRYLKGDKVLPSSYFAAFDSKNIKHRTILARCMELGWRNPDNPQYTDLSRLGSFLISRRSPVRKRLLDMSDKELSKIIYALEQILKKQYAK